METQIDTNIPDWGVDSAPEARPGVPMERESDGMGRIPEPQVARVPVFTHADRQGLTPVFGTAAPPRGLSGLMRKWAYRIPEHKARHFLALILADRVDAIEHGILGGMKGVPVVVFAVVAVGILRRSLRA